MFGFSVETCDSGVRAVDPKIVAREWAIQLTKEWTAYFKDVPDNERYTVTIHCPTWDHVEAVLEIMPYEERKFIMLVNDGESVLGQFNEEEKRRIINVFGEYETHFDKLRSMGFLLIDRTQRLSIVEKERKITDAIARIAFNRGRKYQSEILDRLDVAKQTFLDVPILP